MDAQYSDENGFNCSNTTENTSNKAENTARRKDRRIAFMHPVTGKILLLKWPLPKTHTYCALEEMLATYRLLSSYISEMFDVLERIPTAKRLPWLLKYRDVKKIAKSFNKAVQRLRRSAGLRVATFLPPESKEVFLRHMLQQVYNYSVTQPRKLNLYTAFTPSVYGEVSYDCVSVILKQTPLGPNDYFLDLGSGVGNVVLQVAATSLCGMSVGIERAKWPIKYARRMYKHFERWSSWYGHTHRPFKLLEGDFLDVKFREHFCKATVIFVNNYAFGPELDHQLKIIFSDLKDGTKIISSKPFELGNGGRLTIRNICDPGACLSVRKLFTMSRCVSWTSAKISFYLHTVDHSRIEQFIRSTEKPTTSRISNTVIPQSIVATKTKKKEKYR
ncbi:Histone-lysine N-methyltransferase, H3 lysine-79 specific [Trichinella spiralis]|uniref:Histone-lysine N-methyltransferase, H3 lysine-79 specific n=1 Tax=Trichinella spiralis TaxID=6334 RepID=A0A0V1BIJ8_TRISP|nr:Histone-lysine N-methyltransferase, H3 lysine-79 specific [Trichinella spiralis]